MTTPRDLDAIKLRREIYRPHETDCWQRGRSCCSAHISAEDVPGLIAEVERLRAAMSGTADVLIECADVCGAADEYRAAMLSAVDRLRAAVPA